MARDRMLVQQCVTALQGILQPMAIRSTFRWRALPNGVNLICRITLPDSSVFGLCAFARKGLRPATIPRIIEQIEAARKVPSCDQAIVLTDYVSASLAETLRAARVSFVDSVGNAHLTGLGQISVFHTGNRPPRRRPTHGQYFTESGAKILFFLLRHGPRIRATYRDMQAATGVSLDKISKVLNELAKDRLVTVRARGEYEIADANAVLERWSGTFAAKLEPRILLGEYRSAAGNDFPTLIEMTAAAGLSVVVGGDLAAGWLTDHLRPATVRLYVPEEAQPAVQRNLKLAPARDGNIELCQMFARDLGHSCDEHGVILAHPLVVYAELMSGDDVRLGETALRLKERHLSWIK